MLAGGMVAGWSPSHVGGLPRGTEVLTRIRGYGEMGFGVYERDSGGWAQVQRILQEALAWTGEPTSFVAHERPPELITIR